MSLIKEIGKKQGPSLGLCLAGQKHCSFASRLAASVWQLVHCISLSIPFSTCSACGRVALAAGHCSWSDLAAPSCSPQDVIWKAKNPQSTSKDVVFAQWSICAAAELSAEAQRQQRNPGPGQYDVLPHGTALSRHPRAPAATIGSEDRQCNKRAASA